MRDVGKNIRAIRVSKKMTQDTLAELLFVTRQTVSNYENGRSRPDLDMILKIAEVLDTDVNTIIYGPPLPEEEKRKYRHLFISLLTLLLFSGAYLIIRVISKKDSLLYTAPRILNNLVLLPAVLFTLGWTFLHILSLFCNFDPRNTKLTKVARYILWGILGLLIIIPIPYIIWLITAYFHQIGYSSTYMQFPQIPVYNLLLTGIISLTSKFPFVFSFLGCLFRFLGMPITKVKA